MKPLILYHDGDVMCCLSFDDGTWLFWHEDSPTIIAFPDTQPESYEEGSISEIDQLMFDPLSLYVIPEELMDDKRSHYVEKILGLA